MKSKNRRTKKQSFKIKRKEEIKVGRSGKLILMEVEKGKKKLYAAVFNLKKGQSNIVQQWAVDPSKEKKIQRFSQFKKISLDIANKLKEIAKKKKRV